MRFCLKWPLKNIWKWSSEALKGAAIKFFQHLHLPMAVDFIEL
jgi:hypothetical protein